MTDSDSNNVIPRLGEPLPDDVVELIVDELQDDKTTLIACSLASSCFSAPCRKHLFSNIHLDQERHERIEDLFSIFTSIPRISIYVRSLTLVLHHKHEPDGTTLSKLLSTLSHLRRLSIGQKSAEDRVSWVDLSPKLRSALLGLLWSDPLLEAKIAYFDNFPLWTLCGRSSLTELCLVDVFPSKTSSDDDAPKNIRINTPPMGVHSLSIDLSHSTCQSHHTLILEIPRIACLSSLCVLSVNLFCTTQVREECHRWLDECSKGLQYHFPVECCNISKYHLDMFVSLRWSLS